MTSFHTLLVANRGEIARRIIRAARAMGIRTIAVHSDPDADAPHVRDADEARRLPGATATETYLDLEQLVALAAAERAAVHPGYGFLAERADFARAVLDVGLVWVGPSPDAIAGMGDKVQAKVLAEKAGVPVLPGAELPGDDAEVWARAVADVGYPLVVKAAAGGGGKGMRRVDEPGDLAEAVRGARREALAAFGDATVFAEQWLAAPRHVEVQVVADHDGNVIHLGERECSIQRRHQKIIEEAPSPVVDDELRARLGAAAVSLAAKIGYRGVGTVEFLFDGGAHWFLEMNTRLQVEHPVTEEVTGLDLVRLQLEIAAGAPLAIRQEDVRLDGHAIEVRLSAEDPTSGFLPTTGTISEWGTGAGTALRHETGVDAGTQIGPWYDPMLAKVISHAATRTEAAARLAAGLRAMSIHGVTTNRDYLVRVLDDADFRAGATFITYVETHPELLDAPGAGVEVLEAAAIAALAAIATRREADPSAAWAPAGFGRPPQTVDLTWRGEPVSVTYLASARPDPWVRVYGPGDLRLGPIPYAVEVGASPTPVHLDGVPRRATVATHPDATYVNTPLGQHRFELVPRFRVPGPDEGTGGPTAPVPGTITSVEVTAGDRVAAGDTLVVLEAMKMEHRIVAPSEGAVVEVLVQAGDNVDAHQLLVRLELDHG